MWEMEYADEEAEEDGRGFEDLTERVEGFEIVDHGLAGLESENRVVARVLVDRNLC